MCREKVYSCNATVDDLGSPLRVQGKVAIYLCSRSITGITPACAGKSCFFRYVLRRWQDHPCVCREKFSAVAMTDSNAGSPLRVQGKVVVLFALIVKTRITPACAGKSMCSTYSACVNGDHPCVCREKLILVTNVV